MTVKNRVAWYVAYVVGGAVLFVLGMLDVSGNGDQYLCGIGGGLVGVGAIRLVQEARRVKDPAYAKRLEVNASDERNVFVAGKSAQITFKWSILGLAIANIVLRPFGYHLVANVLGVVMCMELVVYWVSYLVLSRRY
ncbi:MAG: hypothetical protein Q4A07_00065 [Coriobacteriales bacterium]|nr:hypothetical protein [Coriobacteriales bacterium]